MDKLLQADRSPDDDDGTLPRERAAARPGGAHRSRRCPRSELPFESREQLLRPDMDKRELREVVEMLWKRSRRGLGVFRAGLCLRLPPSQAAARQTAGKQFIGHLGRCLSI